MSIQFVFVWMFYVLPFAAEYFIHRKSNSKIEMDPLAIQPLHNDAAKDHSFVDGCGSGWFRQSVIPEFAKLNSLPAVSLNDVKQSFITIISAPNGPFHSADKVPFSKLRELIHRDVPNILLPLRALLLECKRQRYIKDAARDLDKIRAKFLDPRFLPSRAEIVEAFGSQLPDPEKLEMLIRQLPGLMVSCFHCCTCGTYACSTHFAKQNKLNMKKLTRAELLKRRLNGEFSANAQLQWLTFGEAKKLLADGTVGLYDFLETLVGCCYKYSAVQFFYMNAKYFDDAVDPPFVPLLKLMDRIKQFSSSGTKFGNELLTAEFIVGLAKYLIRSCSEKNAAGIQDSERSPVILEVGSGSGRLAHFLNKKLNELGSSLHVIATDYRPCVSRQNEFEVEAIDQQDAVAKFQPDIILCSWMPYDQDWTCEWRRTCPQLHEYILIGEPINCGSFWETYGYISDEFEIGKIQKSEMVAPFEIDGWQQTVLPEISCFQVGTYNARHGITADCDLETVLTRTIAFHRGDIPHPRCRCCGSDASAKRCSKCKRVYYCSRECQRADWKAHRPECTLYSSAEKSAHSGDALIVDQRIGHG